MAVVILNAAYAALLASTFTRTVTWLRLMLVLGAIGFVFYGLIEDIQSMVIWNAVIGGMHLFKVIRDYRAQRAVNLTVDEQSLRDRLFPGLSDFDFNLLWGMGREVAYDDQVMIEEGSLPDTVSIVLDGTAVVERRGEVARGIRSGGLVGEMSFISGQPADVSVLAKGRVLVHEWDQRHLASLDQVHPASAKAFRHLMSQDLVAKARA